MKEKQWRELTIIYRVARAVSFLAEARRDTHAGAQEVDMLWTIVVVLLILWLLGFSLHIGGGLIHLLLVVGLVVLVINLLSGRRSGV